MNRATPAIPAHERERTARSVMDAWKSAVDAHEPRKVASLFAADAVFQGLHPYGVGREAVVEYFESQPVGLEVAYTIMETRQIAEDAVLAFLRVEGSFADRPPATLHLGVLLEREAGDWLIRHYQVTKLD